MATTRTRTRNEKIVESVCERWWQTNPEILEGVDDPQPRNGFVLFAKPAKKSGYTFSIVTDESGWRYIPFIIHDTLEKGYTPIAIELVDTPTVYFGAVRRMGGRKVAQRMIVKYHATLAGEYV